MRIFKIPAAGLGAGLLACALLISGCSTVEDTSFESLLQDDRQLEQGIVERLREDPITAAQGLGVRVDGGAVTVYGSVSSESIRARALAVVRNTPGVVDVKDSLRLYTW